MASFGTPFFILNQFGFYEPLLALFFAFGLLFLVVGFGMYYDDWEKKSGKKRRRPPLATAPTSVEDYRKAETLSLLSFNHSSPRFNREMMNGFPNREQTHWIELDEVGKGSRAAILTRKIIGASLRSFLRMG